MGRLTVLACLGAVLAVLCLGSSPARGEGCDAADPAFVQPDRRDLGALAVARRVRRLAARLARSRVRDATETAPEAAGLASADDGEAVRPGQEARRPADASKGR